MSWIQTMFPKNNKPARRGAPSPKGDGFKPRLMELEDRRVLATLFVDDTLTTGVAGTFNPGRYDSTPVAANRAFGTLAAAIAAATSGDTIRVGEGPTLVAPGTVLNKSLTIIGSRVSATNPTPVSVLRPTGDTGTAGDASAWFLISGTGVNLSLTTLDVAGENAAGVDFFIRNGFRTTTTYTGTTAFDNVIFRTITTFPATQYDGTAIVAQNGTVNVSNSRFSGIGRTGILYIGAATAGTVMNVDYFGKGIGDHLDYGVDIQSGADVIVTASSFVDNRGIAAVDQSGSAGVQIFDTGSTLGAYGNLFRNNQIGLFAGFDGTDAPGVIANFNNFINNQFSVSTFLPVVADVRNNFFGTFTGTPPVSPALNGIETLGTAADTSGTLYEKTWVWYGNSRQSYLNNTSFFAVGTGAGDIGTPGTARVFDNTTGVPQLGVRVGPNGERDRVLGVASTTGDTQLLAFYPYGTAYRAGGVTVDIGDVDGDYRPDLITGTTTSSLPSLFFAPHVKVFDVLSGVEKASFFAFPTNYFGGVNVRAADLNGDGTDEIVAAKGPDLGASSIDQVRVFSYQLAGNPTQITQFAAYAGYGGAISVGSGDLNADGKDEIVTGNLTGVTQVRIFGYSPPPGGTIPGSGNPITPNGTVGQVAPAINPYGSFAGGVFVDVVDSNGDGIGEIITGAGPSGGPHVRTFELANPANLAGGFAPKLSFFGYETGFTGGIRVAGARMTGTVSPQIFVGPGPGRPTTNNGFLTNPFSQNVVGFVGNANYNAGLSVGG